MSSIFIWGPPGSGKTTLAASISGLGYTPIFIDIDHKIRTMVNIKPLLASGKIRVIDIKSKLVNTSLRGRLDHSHKDSKFDGGQQPMGYFELVDIIDGLEKNRAFPPEIQGDIPSSEVVPIIDSTTSMGEHLYRLALSMGRTTKADFGEWAFIKSNLEELFTVYYNILQPDIFPHTIMIAHAQTDTDENTHLSETKPMFEGSMRDKVGKYVEEQYYCRVDSRDPKDVKYYVKTRPFGIVQQARTSRPIQTEVVSDFKVIFKDEYEQRIKEGKFRK